MKRFVMTIALACALSSTALAGHIPTSGAPSPGNIPMTESEPGNIPTGGSTSPGNIPTSGSTLPGEMPTIGLSALLVILELAF